MAMAARTTAVVSFAICFIFGVGCSWGGCVDNESSCGVAFKLSNRFFGALARARFFFGFRPRLLGIGKQWVGGLVRSRIRYPLLANAVQRLLTAMVGQDREEANRLQQAKWELTSRIRDESNVPNAFHFSRRSRKRYSAETVPQPVTASQGTILCKVARNSVNRRCPMETALPGWRG